MNSRSKGKRGELEWAAFLRERGIAARRGAQYAGKVSCILCEGKGCLVCDQTGMTEAPDVVTELDYHFEVKRTERLSLYPAVEQAKRDSAGSVPVVAHRRNRQEWLVVMRAEDWLSLVKQTPKETE